MKTWYIAIMMVLALVVTVNAEVRVSIDGGQKVSEESKLSVNVKIPFDEEYRITLQNKDNGRRALIHIRIDGRKATGGGLILREGETINLERFLDSGTLTKGKKFKFVPKDDESLRPDNPEDGQIVVTVQYEKSKKPVVEYAEVYSSSITIPYSWRFSSTSLNMTSNTTSGDILARQSENIKGITVEGGESIQRFQKDSVSEMDDQIDTLTIKLIGYFKKPPILMNK